MWWHGVEVRCEKKRVERFPPCLVEKHLFPPSKKDAVANKGVAKKASQKRYRKKDMNKRGRISPCVYGENGEAVDENDDSCGDSGLLEGAPSRLLDVLQRLLLNVVHRDECNLVVGALR